MNNNEITENSSINTNNIVSKHNILVHKSYKLSLSETKLLSGIISLVNSLPLKKGGDTEFRTYRITTEEAHKMLGFKSNSSFGDIRKAFEGLHKGYYSIDLAGEDGYEEGKMLHWIDETSYKTKDGIGYYDIKLGNHLHKYLLGLEGDFTSYKLKNILNLQSSQTIRMYELLKSGLNGKKKIITVKELRRILQLENKYPLFANLKIKVLEITKKEINDKTDIKVSYKPIKEGRKVVALEFIVENNNKIKNKIEKFESNIEVSIDNMLLGIGIKSNVLNDLLIKYGRDKLTDNYNLLLKEANKGTIIRNKAGWFLDSLKKNYIIKNNIKTQIITDLYINNERLINMENKKDSEAVENKKKIFKNWFEKLDKSKKCKLMEDYKTGSPLKDKEMLVRARISTDFQKGLLN